MREKGAREIAPFFLPCSCGEQRLAERRQALRRILIATGDNRLIALEAGSGRRVAKKTASADTSVATPKTGR